MEDDVFFEIVEKKLKREILRSNHRGGFTFKLIYIILVIILAFEYEGNLGDGVTCRSLPIPSKGCYDMVTYRTKSCYDAPSHRREAT